MNPISNATHNKLRYKAPSALARRRARGQAGQSITVAVIVLFLLMFIGGIFIAIVAGNIKGTKRAAATSASGRFAEAGIRYLQEQLDTAPEGADWRPVPDCTFGGLCNGGAAGDISQRDPDYQWLRPCTDTDNNGVEDDAPCGFTRVNFGSDTAASGEPGASAGGRALVRLDYQPNASDPLSRYIKLQSVGRVGQVLPLDPTTFSNSESIGQRVELLAYKAIGLNEYVRNVINKDNKPVTATFGTIAPVRDRGTLINPETVIKGPIHANTSSLTFYGINRIILDPRYNESIEVAGNIYVNGVGPNATALTNGDLSQVYVYTDTGAGITPVVPAGLPAGSPSIFPSDNPRFSTLAPEYSAQINAPTIALVRDNPRGNEVNNLPQNRDAFGNAYQNQRSVPRVDAPLMDAPTGPNGTTRYRAITRNSPPLAPMYTQNNPVAPALGAQNLAGSYGWGEGMYIPNTADIQNNSENLTGGYSLRGDWLNPPASNVGTSSDKSRWRGDFEYVPEGVVITLYPAYFTVEASAYDGSSTRRQFFFRKPNAPNEGGRLRDVRKILRYTRTPEGIPAGIGTGVVNAEAKFEGYPADTLGPDRIPNTNDDTPYYDGDFVIFAEGNIRIRGVVGGRDSESGRYFKRHLTVVSNANIYVEGNLLRDNILSTDSTPEAAAVRGQSTIALLAKNYIAVNTTQFLSPNQTLVESETVNSDTPAARILPVNPGQESRFVFRTTFGPAALDPANGFVAPPYLTGAGRTIEPAIYLRHSASGAAAPENTTNINLFVNETAPAVPNLVNFGPYANADYQFAMALSGPNTADPNDKTPVYLYNRFDQITGFLFPTNTFPYPNATNPPPVGPRMIGVDNFMAVNLDQSATNPPTKVNYRLTRVGVAPLDIRIEALMYAQEGSFFIIPGPWFNPNPNDSYENFADGNFGQNNSERGGRRAGELQIGGRQRVNNMYPFYKEPMDIRITFCGSINENLTAEIADQSAWLEKWGWVPSYYGSTGLQELNTYPDQGNQIPTIHGPQGALAKMNTTLPGAGGQGIVYEFDERALAPYAPAFSSQANRPLRRNPYNPLQPLPFAPRLPVAPGLLYYGQNTIRP